MNGSMTCKINKIKPLKRRKHKSKDGLQNSAIRLICGIKCNNSGELLNFGKFSSKYFLVPCSKSCKEREPCKLEAKQIDAKMCSANERRHVITQ